MCAARRGKRPRVLRSSLLILEGDTSLLEVCLRWNHEGWDPLLSAHGDTPHGKPVLPSHPAGSRPPQAPSPGSSLPAAASPAARRAQEWCPSGDCHLVGNRPTSVHAQHGQPHGQQPRRARKIEVRWDTSAAIQPKWHPRPNFPSSDAGSGDLSPASLASQKAGFRGDNSPLWV